MARYSFEIVVRENVAVVTVKLVLYTPERVERAEVEAAARAYVSQTLDLIRD